MAIIRRPLNCRRRTILTAVCLAAVAVSTSFAQRASPGETPPATQPAAARCHSCGIEILQTPMAFDSEGHPLCSRCAAQTAPPQVKKEEPKAYDLRTAKRLTGDWGGVRTQLEDMGLSFNPIFGTVAAFNFRGGLNTHNAHDVAGGVFYNLELDFQKMARLKGATLFVRGIQTWNAGIGPDVGSLTPPYVAIGSSGDREIELDKWWYRQRLFDDRLEFRLGKINTTDLFDRNDYADNYVTAFTNQAHYYNPAVPSTKGLGAYVKVWPWDWLYLSGAVLDPDTDNDLNRRGTSSFDTAFHGEDRFRAYWEIGLAPKFTGPKGSLPGHYRFGGWYDPKPKKIFLDDLEGLRAEYFRSGDVGFYTNFDQMVWKENDDPKDKQGLGVFARYGFGHQDVNRVNHFWAVGASYLGLVPARDKDVLGFAVGQSILSNTYQYELNPLADRETVYELYYAFEVTPWFTVTPDVQVITHPGGHNDARDALVGGVRVKIAF